MSQFSASLCNGPSNYSVEIPHKKEEKALIIIGCSHEKENLPTFDRKIIRTIAHEFAHHYTNSQIYQYWDQLDPAAQIIYPHVKDQMARLTYGDAKTTIVEWFTDLIAIMYIQDNNSKDLATDYTIARDQNRGFI